MYEGIEITHPVAGRPRPAGQFWEQYARVRVMGSYTILENHGSLPVQEVQHHGVHVTIMVIHCPRTGRVCSEVICRERCWCRKMLERGDLALPSRASSRA